MDVTLNTAEIAELGDAQQFANRIGVMFMPRVFGGSGAVG